VENKQIADTQDILTAIYIQQSRVYDVLLAILSGQDKPLAASIIEAHERGELLSPPPALIGDENDSVDTTEA
jgi:hypothetical protein